ncbi:myrosinase 1-like [Anoplophora glabripennis]|uniref:myrosinase 1-like n=1 Tax=Anoplophora glabripennis TaxID=217634 RepID=UPI00087560B8|nr:myrosinase 1-like [Anoplophora glabripennis]
MQFLLICLLFSKSLADQYNINKTPFPDYFKFGAATAAYQIEGAWNEDGKGENIWDHFCHTRPKAVLNEDNGDIACDSYHLWERDIEMLKELGVNHYRFSISWARILPTGYTNVVSKEGINYYTKLIKELKRNNIEPMVTLYHWDLPQTLQDLGGWTNDIVVDAFVNFARICFESFGKYVRYWITVNEPFQVCHPGYGDGSLAPGLYSPGIGEYLCAHNLIKGHARVWRVYDDQFRDAQKGVISMAVHCGWYQAESNTTEDLEAAETKSQFVIGLYMHPIYLGDYPKVVKDRIAMRSEKEGFSKSRLPEFSEEEIEYIKDTHDFFGINYYSTYNVKAIAEPPIGEPSFEKDCGVFTYSPPEWESTQLSVMKNTPWGFRKMLKWIKDEYNSPEILVTENGIAIDEQYNDVTRIRYLKEHLSSVRDAMMFDDVNVTLYTVWSLLDNFEWSNGYTPKFGVYETNFSSPERTRTPRRSAKYYKHVATTHGIVWSQEN